MSTEELFEHGLRLAGEMWGAPPRLTLAADPRWDQAGFARALSFAKEGQHAVAFVRVEYLRGVAASGQPLPRRQDCPRGALHFGAPPDGVQLFKVTEPWLTPSHPDPQGDHLRALVRVLDRPAWEGGPAEAAPDDLVFFDWASSCQKDGDGVRTALEEELNLHVWAHINPLLHTYYRVRLISLPDIPQWVHDQQQRADPPPTTGRKDDEPRSHSYNTLAFYQRVCPVWELLLSTFCQRAVNAYHPEVKKAQDPGLFANPRQLFKRLTLARLATVHAAGVAQGLPRAKIVRAAAGISFDFEKVCGQLVTLVQRMPIASEDDLGFSTFCSEAAIAWVLVGYLRELARQGGPFPRRQELRAGSFVIGDAAGHRRFVVSHGWEAEHHPSPSGSKLWLLVEALQRLGATDADVVFMDYMSCPQKGRQLRTDAYYRLHGGEPPRTDEQGVVTWYAQADRTASEVRCFRHGLWDMGRLYAYRGCEVVVLPKAHAGGRSADFPGGPELWGRVKRTSYEQSGWCCAEYAIARFNGRVANRGDADVLHVERSRRWPESIQAYQEMMDDDALPVCFTDKGDRSVVVYNFFKMAFSLRTLDDAVRAE